MAQQRKGGAGAVINAVVLLPQVLVSLLLLTQAGDPGPAHRAQAVHCRAR